MIMYLAQYNPAQIGPILDLTRSAAFSWLLLLNEHYESLKEENNGG